MTSPITLPMMRQSLYSGVVCDALDSLGFRHQSPRISMVPIAVESPLIGRCKTTLWVDFYHPVANPYELELKAVDSCSPDDVFIAAAAGSTRSAVWGELLSTAARNRGCVGAIVDGLARDTTRLAEMRFTTFARGTSPYDSQNRQRVVDMNVPVEIDGVCFAPGDLVIADMDGIVVVPSEVETEAIQQAWNKVHTENAIRTAILNGATAEQAYAQFGTL